VGDSEARARFRVKGKRRGGFWEFDFLDRMNRRERIF
jgi:hypothetical protein